MRCVISILKSRKLHLVFYEISCKTRRGNILTCAQLSFSNPNAYNEIYAASNRWDKDPTLYLSFGQDRAIFGNLKYEDAKQRKNILSPMFSRKAVSEYQALIQSNVGSFISPRRFRSNFSG
jgi:hypothetical protein